MAAMFHDLNRRSSADLLRAEAVSGLCRVICFSPRHDLTLAQMERIIEDLLRTYIPH